MVFIHAQFPEPFGKWVETIAKCAVPYFFMRGGYFLYSESRDIIERRLIRNIKKIVLLSMVYFGIYLVNDVIRCLLGNAETNQDIASYVSNLFSLESILRLLVFDLFPVTSPMGWFLLAMLIAYFFLLLVNKKTEIRKIYFLIPILFAIYYFVRLILPTRFEVLDIHENYMYARNWLFDGLPYILLGHMIRKNEHQLKKLNVVKCLFLLTFFALFGVLEYEFLKTFNREVDFYVSNIIVAVSFFTIASINTGIGKDSILARIGEKHSTFVYIMHGFVITSIVTVLNIMKVNETTCVNWTRPLIVLITTLLLSWGWNYLRQTISKHQK